MVFCIFVFLRRQAQKLLEKNQTHPRYLFTACLFTHFAPAIVQGRGQSMQKETCRVRALEQKTLSRFYSPNDQGIGGKVKGPHSLGLGRGNWAPFGRTGRGGLTRPPLTLFRGRWKKKFLFCRAVRPLLASPLGGSDPSATKTFFALPGNLPRQCSPPTGDSLFFFPARHSGFCRFTRPDLFFMYCP